MASRNSQGEIAAAGALHIAIVIKTSCGQPFTGPGPIENGFGSTLYGVALRLPKRSIEMMLKSKGIETFPSPLSEPPAFTFVPGVRKRTQISLRK
jgi:hypothetical protein